MFHRVESLLLFLALERFSLGCRKVIGFALLRCLTIKNFQPIRSETKLRFVRRRFPALRPSHVYLPQVVIGSPVDGLCLGLAVVITKVLVF